MHTRFLHIVTLRRHVYWFDGFSSAWHAESFPDRPYARRFPLLDYFHAAKGWFPMSEFDSWYLSVKPDAAEFAGPLLMHFLKYDDRSIDEVKENFNDILQNPTLNQSLVTDIFVPELKLENLPDYIFINVPKFMNLDFIYDDKMYGQIGDNTQVVFQLISENYENSKKVFEIELCDSGLVITIQDTKTLVLDLPVLLALVSQVDWVKAETSRDLIESFSAKIGDNYFYQRHLMKLHNSNFFSQTSGRKQVEDYILKGGNKLGRVKSIEYFNDRNVFKPPSRIILVSHEDKRSGSPLFLKRIAEVLHRNGLEIKIVIFSGDNPDDIFQSLGVDYEFLDWRMERLELSGPAGTNWLLSPNGDLAFSDIVNDFRPDVVLLNSLATSTFAGPLSLLRIPFMNYVHENWAGNLNLVGTKDPFVKSVQFALERSTLNLFGSNDSKENWSSLYQMHRIETLHSLIPISNNASNFTVETMPRLKDDLGIGENTIVFLAISVFEPRKCIEDILISFKSANLSDARLILVGKCGRFPDYERMINELIEDDPRIIICKSTKNIQPYFDLATVFVHASKEEVFPLVLQQAIVSNLPIICSSYSGYQELLGVDYQFIFTVGNRTELTNLMSGSSFKLAEMLVQVRHLQNKFEFEELLFGKTLLDYLEVLNAQLIFSSKEK